MKTKKHLMALLLAVTLTLAACIDLEHINTFCTTAVKTLATYDEANYSFTYSYNHFTQTKEIYDTSDRGKFLNVPVLTPTSKDLDSAMKADKGISTFISGISAYFAGISKLTNKDLVDYKFDDVAKAMKADKVLRAKLKLTGDDGDKKIDAMGNIATIFTNVMMGAYREKKVKDIIIKYDSSLTLSINALITMMRDCLLENIKNDTIIINLRYVVMLREPNTPDIKKIELRKECMEEKVQLEKSRQHLLTLIKALEKMRDAHNDVAKKLKDGKMSSKEIMDQVKIYATDLFEIYDNIKVIQK